MTCAALVAFDQRHLRSIDRNHHARGVGVDFNWDAPQFVGCTEGIDDVQLSQHLRRHLDDAWDRRCYGPSSASGGFGKHACGLCGSVIHRSWRDCLRADRSFVGHAEPCLAPSGSIPASQYAAHPVEGRVQLMLYDH